MSKISLAFNHSLFISRVQTQQTKSVIINLIHHIKPFYSLQNPQPPKTELQESHKSCCLNRNIWREKQGCGRRGNAVSFWTSWQRCLLSWLLPALPVGEARKNFQYELITKAFITRQCKDMDSNIYIQRYRYRYLSLQYIYILYIQYIYIYYKAKGHDLLFQMPPTVLESELS